MLAVSNGCVVLQVFCNNSQYNIPHDFPGTDKTDGLPVTRVISLTLENWDSVCKLSVNQDLYRFPRLFRNHYEVSHNDISHPFEEYSWINPTRPLRGIHLEKKIPVL